MISLIYDFIILFIHSFIHSFLYYLINKRSNLLLYLFINSFTFEQIDVLIN